MSAVRRSVRRALRLTVVVLAAAAAGMVPAVSAVAQGGDEDPRLLFLIEDDRVIESSALAISRTRPGLAYTVNDSGDDARVLVLSMRDGSVVGETTLVGVEHDDFEALAPAGGGRLLVGDIGDNGAERDSVEVYVLGEPGRGDREVRPRTVSLTYPGGPRDAEAVVAIGTTVYVISKEAFGSVYAAPVLSSDRGQYRLRRVASAPSVVTGATLLADGRVVLRDYGRAYVVARPGWRVQTSFRLPRVQLGESVAARPRGRRIYVGSEGLDSPVYVLTVPPAARVARSDPPRPPGAADPSPGQTRDDDGLRLRPYGYGVAVAAAMVAGLLARRRRRRRGRPPIQIR